MAVRKAHLTKAKVSMVCLPHQSTAQLSVLALWLTRLMGQCVEDLEGAAANGQSFDN